MLPVAIVIFFTAFSFGGIATLTPDLSKSIGLENKGLYFLIYTIASLVVRIVAGRWSDKNGRVQVLKIGSALLVVALLFTAFTFNLTVFIIASFTYGLAMGILSPISQAWTIDLADDNNRGRAVATMYIALEVGIGIGAVLTAWIYGNDNDRLPYAFLLAAAFALVAVIYLIAFQKKQVLNEKQ